MFKRKEEDIAESIKGDISPRSRARKIRILFKKNKGLIKDKEAMTDFKEPVVMLIRRSRAVEFFEDASKGEFTFKHSDGKIRSIYLEPSQQVSFDYGKRKFRGYICHEDYPLPLPEIPIVTADTINMIVEKSMMDLKRLNEREKELQLRTWKTIGWFALGGALIFILWRTGAIDKIINGLLSLVGVRNEATTPIIIESAKVNISTAINNPAVQSRV